MKKCYLILMVVLVLMATELSMFVHSREIRGTMAEKASRIGCDELQGEKIHEASLRMDQFMVASNNSSHNSGGRNSLKGMGFMLASGPSKKGPGH
ncbi:hypothetical protein LIER_32273 [Lithospermum erythrorhizon]|uniref:Uncharacterized protein n=1 Tax=Lithospermum erythrorhizon TaxID=34254 RepID=A0AAV3RWU5_LITER